MKAILQNSLLARALLRLREWYHEGDVYKRHVHGGEFFSDSVIITEKVLKAIEDCVPLAPLHNPPNLIGIQACREVMGPDVPMVAVFDTAFHQTMPQSVSYTHLIPSRRAASSAE